MDTSTLIGVLTGKRNGNPAQAVNLALLWYQPVMSQETWDELERVASRSAFDKFRPLAVRGQFLAKYREACSFHPVTC